MDFVLFFFFSDPNTDLFCSCRAPVQNSGAIIFSPRAVAEVFFLLLPG
jgi:hypothetical protein